LRTRKVMLLKHQTTQIVMSFRQTGLRLYRTLVVPELCTALAFRAPFRSADAARS
jgi:hypothetical protein